MPPRGRHPGAQLRFTDHDGHRFQVFLTDQPDPGIAGLELRHRQHARVEDRIRAAKATGLANLPFDLWRRNAVWPELVLCAQDLTCWTQALLLNGHLAVAEPKTLRYRLLHVAARVARHTRRLIPLCQPVVGQVVAANHGAEGGKETSRWQPPWISRWRRACMLMGWTPSDDLIRRSPSGLDQGAVRRATRRRSG